MPLIENYVRIESGKCKVLRFDDWTKVTKVITDPLTGWTKEVEALLLHVVEEDGEKVSKVFSVLSSKLANTLWPYLESGEFKKRAFRICKSGTGFLTDYTVEVL